MPDPTVEKAPKSPPKLTLPKVPDQYIEQKVESTTNFPTPKNSKDKDGGGPEITNSPTPKNSKDKDGGGPEITNSPTPKYTKDKHGAGPKE